MNSFSNFYYPMHTCRTPPLLPLDSFLFKAFPPWSVRRPHTEPLWGLALLQGIQKKPRTKGRGASGSKKTTQTARQMSVIDPWSNDTKSWNEHQQVLEAGSH